MSFSSTMSEFYGVELGTSLFLVHQGHEYRAIGYHSGKLLCGLVGSTHYPDRLHKDVIEQAEQRDLSVSTWESDVSMLTLITGSR